MSCPHAAPASFAARTWPTVAAAPRGSSSAAIHPCLPNAIATSSFVVAAQALVDRDADHRQASVEEPRAAVHPG